MAPIIDYMLIFLGIAIWPWRSGRYLLAAARSFDCIAPSMTLLTRDEVLRAYQTYRELRRARDAALAAAVSVLQVVAGVAFVTELPGRAVIILFVGLLGIVTFRGLSARAFGYHELANRALFQYLSERGEAGKPSVH